MKRNHATGIRKAGKEKGFTLLEVMIAVAILAFGLLAVASMQGTAIRGNSLSGNLTAASTLAADRMEKLVSASYSHADLDVGNHTEDVGTYTVAWNIAEDAMFNNTKTVSVAVTWAEGGSQKAFGMQGVKGR